MTHLILFLPLGLLIIGLIDANTPFLSPLITMNVGVLKPYFGTSS
jgi:hypothetical protein